MVSTHSPWVTFQDLPVTFQDLPVTFQDLPETFRSRVIDARMHSEGEKDRLLAVLLSTRWNKAEAARKLSWSRMTLYRKMERYQISRVKSNMVTCP